MSIILSYAYNPDVKDQKLYALIQKNLDDETVWLASTIKNQTSGFETWQLIWNFPKEQIDIVNMIVNQALPMQIKNNTLFIVNRRQTFLFVIPIAKINEPIEPVKLPSEFNDYADVYQLDSLYITPNKDGVILYMCASNKILQSDDNGYSWQVLQEFADEDGVEVRIQAIAGNEFILVARTLEGFGEVFLARMGTNNFQKYSLGEPNDVYGVFFNDKYSILILLDSHGYVRTFKYDATGANVKLTPLNVERVYAFNMPEDLAGSFTDAMKFGGNLTIGVINPAAYSPIDFASIDVNSNGAIEVNQLIKFNIQVDGEYLAAPKFVMDTHGPLLYLNFDGILYVSFDLGKTWKQQDIKLISAP